MRAVIYARYSTELQREASIEDQVRACQERIEKEGWSLTATYTDHALSGSVRLRPGYQKLLEDARSGLFDVVVAEALDRLSRDQEDVAGPLQAAELCRRSAPYPGRGRGLRVACRAQGHHERALPQGPRPEGPPGPGGPRAPGPLRWWPLLWLRRGAPAGRPWRASPWRSPGQRGRGGGRAAHIHRVRRRPVATRHRRWSQQGLGPRPPGPGLGAVDHLRQLAPGHRHPQQRALCRPPGLEPAALHQGSQYPQARGTTQSGAGLDHPVRARAQDRR